MRILADCNIPYVYKLFGWNNYIMTHSGRAISYKNVQDIDVLLTRSVTQVNQALLDDSLVRFVGTATSGIDHVDYKYLKKYGIKFVSAPGSNTIAVVEYVFSALLALTQNHGCFLRDKTVGIVGVGNIGSLLHQRLYDFGVNTLLCDPPLEKKYKSNRSWKSLDKIISDADILTFHTPLIYNGDYPTWHMIDFDVLEALPSNTMIINTCRGSIIDNSALLTILRNGKKLNVVLDVWEFEPVLSLSLLSYVNIGTAHIAGYTYESKIRSIIQIYQEYCNFFDVYDCTVDLNLLSLPIVHNIKINRKIDEFLLNKLINLIYNIRYDDVLLRCAILQSDGFDRLRKNYLCRREWSSIYVESNLDYNNEILSKLGFTVGDMR